MVRDSIRQALTLLAVCMVILGTTTYAGMGPTGTAQAEFFDECAVFGTEDSEITVDSWLLHAIAGDDCQILGSGEETDTSKIDDNQTALDIYSHAATVEQSWDEYQAVANNYITDSRTVAYSKAQAAAIEAMDAGKNESQVIEAARQAVEDYYTLREMNYVKAWETKMVTLEELALRAQNESGVSNKLIKAFYFDSFYAIDDSTGETFTYNLINGTSLSLHEVSYGGGNYAFHLTHVQNYADGQEKTNGGSQGVYVESIDSDHPSFEVLSQNTTEPFVSDLASTSQQVENNIEKWVNGTYEDFQSGALNLSDAVNPMTLAQEYAQKYSETGYYAYAAASLAAAGYSVPNLNETASMTIAYNGSEYTGLLMSQNAPDGGVWEAGKTYDTDLIEGAQFFATNGEIMELSGTFQIMSMQAPDGSSINSTTTQTYSYQTVNTSEYLDLQNSLTDLRTQLEALTAGLSSGGGGGLLGDLGWGLDLNKWISKILQYGSVILLIGGVLIVFLLMLSAASS